MYLASHDHPKCQSLLPLLFIINKVRSAECGGPLASPRGRKPEFRTIPCSMILDPSQNLFSLLFPRMQNCDNNSNIIMRWNGWKG